MSTWDATLAFQFAPDYDRRDAPAPAAGYVAKRVVVRVATEATIDVAAAVVFAVYSKFEGDDAVLVLDGRPPVAATNPYATSREQPFSQALASVAAQRDVSSADSKTADTRKGLCSKLKEKSATPAVVSSTAALVGCGVVISRTTATSIGDAALVSAFDMVWIVSTPSEDTIEFALVYNRSVYAPATASDRVDVLQLVCDAFQRNADFNLVRDVETLTASMKQRLLCDWQTIRVPKSIYNRTLADVFIETVETRCGNAEKKIAVEEPSTGREITYAAMLRRARKLAIYLHRNVPCSAWGVDATCGIHVPRCLDWYVMMVGIHLAGGAYLSLDPDFPADRLLYTLEDSGAVCLFTLRRMVGSLGYQGPTLAIDELWPEIDAIELPSNPPFQSPANGTSPAYLIYTSGSTGKPKGVCIEHRNAVNFVESERIMYQLDNTPRVIQGFSTSFDASVEEIWLAFANGGTLIVVDKAVMQDVEQLGKLVEAERCTVLSTVPTLLATIDSKLLRRLEIVIAGGEACNKEVVAAYATGGKRRFVNSYGPTEATVACFYDLSEPDRPVTIGNPQPGYFACIINDRMELVPPGVPGELCMAGPSVARGYVNREDLTAEKFCYCPHLSTPKSTWAPYDEDTANDQSYHRMYRTGDLTRFNTDGRVEFLGRIDSQVKLRGFRIEVGEIETNLANFPGVRTAIVHLIKDNGHDYLCGYMMCEAELKAKFTEVMFKDYLKDKLPAYMIPSRFCLLDVVPRSPAGKLDRKQLAPPPPVAVSQSDQDQKVPMATATERQLHAVWCEMFPGMTIGATDDFFEIGGHSLLAGKLASKVRRCGYVDFNIRCVYSHPTIQKMSTVLEGMEKTEVNASGESVADQRFVMPERYQPTFVRKLLFAMWQAAFFTIWSLSSWAYFLLFMLVVQIKEHPDEFVTWLELRQNAVDIVIYGVLLQCVASIWSLFTSLVVCPLWKWIIIGKVVPGTYSIWSFYFLRWWTARALTSYSSYLLLGTEIYSIQMRFMGASIGEGTIVSSVLIDPDLVEIGTDCYIADNAVLVTSHVVDSMLVLKPIRIGNSSTVSHRATVCGGAEIESEAYVEPLALIPDGTVVRRGERWSGSPSSCVGMTQKLSQMVKHGAFRARPTEKSLLVTDDDERQAIRLGRKFGLLIAAFQFLFLFAIGVCSGVGIVAFWTIVLVNYVLAECTVIWLFILAACIPLMTGFVMVWQHIVLIGARYVIFPRSPKPGMYPADGQMFQRKLLFDVIARSSLLTAHPMYGSIFTQYFLKGMGCSVGSRVECSNLYGWTPGLTSFGDESFIADFVGVNPPEIFRGVMKLNRVHVAARAFVGNGSVLPPGTVMEEKSLLGLMSYPANGRVEANKTAIGCPAFEIPRKISVDDVDQKRTFSPPTSLVVKRYIWEYLRCVMPNTFIGWSSFYAIVLIDALRDDYEFVSRGLHDFDPVACILVGLVFIWSIPVFSIFFTLCSKWMVVGRHKAEENPLWSTHVWQAEFVVDVTTVVGGMGPIGFFRGTPFIVILFRLLGTKIGKNCFIDTLFITEPDLVTLGDGVCVNVNATLQTHLFEDRVMKMDTLTIADRATVGAYATVLYNTTIGIGATVSHNTLIMKGESLANHTHWAGIPAQKTVAPQVLRNDQTPDPNAFQISVPMAAPPEVSKAVPQATVDGIIRVADWVAGKKRSK